MQILGAEILTTQDTQALGAMLADFMLAIRQRVPGTMGATFVLNVESNLAFVAESLEGYVAAHRAQFPTRVHVIKNDRRRGREGAGEGGLTDVDVQYTAGTRTTAKTTKESVAVLKALLHGGCVYFARPFIDRLRDRDARVQIVKQLAGFQRILTYPKPKNGRIASGVREQYSGKQGTTQQDDLARTLLILTRTVEQVERDAVFANIR